MILMMSIMGLFIVYVFLLTNEERNYSTTKIEGIPTPSPYIVALVKGDMLISSRFGERALMDFGYGTSYIHNKTKGLTHQLCPITNEIYRIKQTPPFIKEEMKIAAEIKALPWGHTPSYEDRLKHLLAEKMDQAYSKYVKEYTYEQRFPNLYDLCPGFLSLGYKLKNEEDISKINDNSIIETPLLLDFDLFDKRDLEKDKEEYLHNKLVFFKRWCEMFVDTNVDEMNDLEELENVLGYSLKIHSYFKSYAPDTYKFPLEVWKVRFLLLDKKTRIEFLSSFGRCNSQEVFAKYIKIYSYYECIDLLRKKITCKNNI